MMGGVSDICWFYLVTRYYRYVCGFEYVYIDIYHSKRSKDSMLWDIINPYERIKIRHLFYFILFRYENILCSVFEMSIWKMDRSNTNNHKVSWSDCYNLFPSVPLWSNITTTTTTKNRKNSLKNIFGKTPLWYNIYGYTVPCVCVCLCWFIYIFILCGKPCDHDDDEPNNSNNQQQQP